MSTLRLLLTRPLISVLLDSFSLKYIDSSGHSVPVALLRQGIAWYTDKNVKFRNPKIDNLTLAQVFNGNFDQTQRQYFSFSRVSFIMSDLRLLCRHGTASVLAEASV